RTATAAISSRQRAKAGRDAQPVARRGRRRLPPRVVGVTRRGRDGVADYLRQSGELGARAGYGAAPRDGHPRGGGRPAPTAGSAARDRKPVARAARRRTWVAALLLWH